MVNAADNPPEPPLGITFEGCRRQAAPPPWSSPPSPLEYDTLRAHSRSGRNFVHDNGTRGEPGRLTDTPRTVAIAELGQGAPSTPALTTHIVDWPRPQVLISVGVAGGLKDDIEIGDVAVGTKVYAIHGGKQAPQGFQARPEVRHGSHRLLQAARSALRDMPDAQGHRKPIAVGDAVPADDKSVFAAHIRHHHDDARAIETEDRGASHAAHLNGQLDALVIRGISDLANADKHTADAPPPPTRL